MKAIRQILLNCLNRHLQCLLLGLVGLSCVVTYAQQPKKLYYFVVDKSGSIQKLKLDGRIKDAVKKKVQTLGVDDEVRLILFSSKVSTTRFWPSMNPGAKTQFIDYFNSKYVPDGNTDLYDAVVQGLTEIQSIKGKYQSIQVYVLSDGDDTSFFGKKKKKEIIEQLINDLGLGKKDSPIKGIWLRLEGYQPDWPLPEFEQRTNLPGKDIDLGPADPPPLDPRFFFRPTPPHVGQTLIFQLFNPAGVAKATWSFGDEGTSVTGAAKVELKAKHAYSKAGKFNVSVTVEGSKGQKPQTQAGELTVEPSVDFLVVPDSPEVEVGQTVTLVDQVPIKGEVKSREWKIEGHPATTALKPTPFAWSKPGNYQVTLTATFESGVVSSSTKTVKVVSVPHVVVADFTLEPKTVDYGKSVRFTQNSKGAKFYQWNFGDGTAISDPEARKPNPIHVFSNKTDKAKQYEVTLTVADETGANKAVSKPKSVTVNPEIIIPMFDFRPDEPREGQPVQFIDKSVGAKTWSWDFGGGSFSSDENPLYTFKNPTDLGKVFPVTLTITGSSGRKESLRKTLIISPEKIIPMFDFTPNPPKEGQPVQFIDNSTGAKSWSWNFGDGGVSADKNPMHTFRNTTDADKAFPVTLTITGSSGTKKSLQKTLTLGVVNFPVDFTWSPTEPKYGEEVLFVDKSGAAATKWQWDFGDGTTDEGKTIKHEFNSKGGFDVTLTATSAGGKSGRTTKNVQIVDSLVVGSEPIVILSDPPHKAGHPIRFKGDVEGIKTFEWDFGGQGTSEGQIVDFEFQREFTYVVVLSVVTVHGEKRDFSKELTILPKYIPPVIRSTSVKPEDGTVPLDATFSALVAGEFSAASWVTSDGRVLGEPSLVDENEKGKKLELIKSFELGEGEQGEVTLLVIPKYDSPAPEPAAVVSEPIELDYDEPWPWWYLPAIIAGLVLLACFLLFLKWWFSQPFVSGVLRGTGEPVFLDSPRTRIKKKVSLDELHPDLEGFLHVKFVGKKSDPNRSGWLSGCGARINGIPHAANDTFDLNGMPRTTIDISGKTITYEPHD